MYGPCCLGEGIAFKSKGKVFLYMDHPKPEHNIFMCWVSFTNENRVVCCDMGLFTKSRFLYQPRANLGLINIPRYRQRKWCWAGCCFLISVVLSRLDNAHNISIHEKSTYVYAWHVYITIKFTTRVPTIEIPDKWWKKLNSLSHKVWSLIGIAQVLKWTKSSWFKSGEILFTFVERGFPVKCSVWKAWVFICLLTN